MPSWPAGRPDTLVQEFVAAGGDYRLSSILPPDERAELTGLRSAQGKTLEAERYVFACGPWLPKLFPTVLPGGIFPTPKEVFSFAPPEGDDRHGLAMDPDTGDRQITVGGLKGDFLMDVHPAWPVGTAHRQARKTRV